MSRSLRLAVAVAALLALLPGTALAAEVSADAEARFLELINASRAEHGLPGLVASEELRGIARTWSFHMDEVDDLSHNPHYTEQYTGEWNRMGENVGVMNWPGGTIEQKVTGLHQAFLDSPGHRANILSQHYNQAGIGVVLDGDVLWVTVNFLDGPVPAAAQEGEDFSSHEGAGEEPAPQQHRYYLRS